MSIIIAGLLACILVAVLIMIASVYEMDRDFHRKIGELSQKYMMLEHKAAYLEKKLEENDSKDL